MEERAAPLDVVVVQEAREQHEGLPPDNLAVVGEGSGDFTDVRVNKRRILGAEVTEDDNDIVAHSRVPREAELLDEEREALLSERGVDEAQLAEGDPRVRLHNGWNAVAPTERLIGKKRLHHRHEAFRGSCF